LPRHGSSEFHGLYCTPITRKSEGQPDQPIGVLVVDRQKRGVIDDNAGNVIEALSAMLALLLDPS
jgi:signal transduction protein with GAF and PtsI domain